MVYSNKDQDEGDYITVVREGKGSMFWLMGINMRLFFKKIESMEW